MMATRDSKSALLKSRIDNMEYRLRELEEETAKTREALAQLRVQVEATPPALVPLTFSAPLAPRPPVVRRPCVITRQKKVKVVKAFTGKSTKFTPEVCAQIPLWLEEGLSREQIAEMIGCSMNSLQVSCSKRGISLWAKKRLRHFDVELVVEETA